MARTLIDDQQIQNSKVTEQFVASTNQTNFQLITDLKQEDYLEVSVNNVRSHSWVVSLVTKILTFSNPLVGGDDVVVNIYQISTNVYSDNNALLTEINNIENSLGSIVKPDGYWKGFSGTNHLDSTTSFEDALKVLDQVESSGSTSAALNLELQWEETYPSFYTELNYDIDNRISIVDIWDSSSKSIHIFNKQYTYTNNLLTTVLITRVQDNKTLLKTINYSNEIIVSIDRVYTP